MLDYWTIENFKERLSGEVLEKYISVSRQNALPN